VRFRVTANKTRTAAQTPVGAGTPATVFRERRGEMDFLFLFMGGFFLLGTVRGFSNQPWLGVIGLAITATIFGFWIWQRMKPPLSLTIGPDEIVLRRPRDERRIARDATGWLRIEQELQGGQWDLIAHDGDEEVERLFLFGFPLLGVAEACEAHGWPVSKGQ